MNAIRQGKPRELEGVVRCAPRTYPKRGLIQKGLDSETGARSLEGSLSTA